VAPEWRQNQEQTRNGGNERRDSCRIPTALDFAALDERKISAYVDVRILSSVSFEGMGTIGVVRCERIPVRATEKSAKSDRFLSWRVARARP
jgi:hypothetical protein